MLISSQSVFFLINTAFKDFSCIKHYALQNVSKLLAGGYKEMSSVLADHAVAPSYMSPNARGGGSCRVSANDYSCTQEP